MSPRVSFDNELKLLKDNVADMVNRVEKNYENLFEALKVQNEDEIIKIRNNDKLFGKKQREIESQCLFLITKQQPIVSDLRVVTASLKVVTDIERIGDIVADMADLFLRLRMKDLNLFSAHMSGMSEATREIFCEAVDAFVNRNLEGAKKVIKEDDIIDELFNKVKYDLIESLKKESRDADECVDVLMLAKYLEKIGDHAMNICEWEIFQETGNISDMRLL